MEEHGEGHPLIVLHGGPGLDHTVFRPWLDALGDRFRLIYLDQRGQGRSAVVPPSTLTLERLSSDVSAVAGALDLGAYAVLGHSHGSFVALRHAIDHGTGTHYVLLGAVPARRWLDRMERRLSDLEPEMRAEVAAGWEDEADVETEEECRRLLLRQLPFHFADPGGEAIRGFRERVGEMRLAPDVIRWFATSDGERIDLDDLLPQISRPVLVVVAEHDRVMTPEGGWAVAEKVPTAECVLVKDAGHMMFVEKPNVVRRAIVEFFERFPV